MSTIPVLLAASLEFLSPDIVHVVKTPDGAPAVHPYPTVCARLPEAPVPVTVVTNGGTIVYTTAKLCVSENRADGTFAFATASGEPLVKELGAARFPARDWNRTAYTGATQAFAVDPDEAIYGLGDNQTRELDLRRFRGRLMPRNVGDGVPVLASVKGYTIYWNNTSPVNVQGTDDGFVFDSETGGAVDYWFIWGGSLDGGVAGVREISGDVPLLPRWTYGFWQSKERYKTQEEIVEVLARYRQERIPLDGIVQDWQYWGGNPLWNAMEFTGETFTDPKRMIGSIHGLNAKLLITIWQAFGPMTKGYRDMEKEGFLFPFETWPQSSLGHIWPPRKDYPSGARLYDPYTPRARDIYWSNLTRLYDLGIDGWWMDSTDPDHIYKEGDFEHRTALGATFREVRGAYPVACTRGVYEHLRAKTDKRVFLLTRGAGLGEQRYAASVWSGDIQSTWDVLRRQIPGGLNYTLTGNPNFNCDLGGFFAGRWNRDGGVANESWRELYVRWMQLGTFLPMMRSHGTDIPREIFLYGTSGESVYDALVGAVKLRYRLMPYIYSVGASEHFERASFMRPLAADFAADRRTWQVADEFLLGRELLVAPVLRAQYTERSYARPVDYVAVRDHVTYLPDGADWYLFATDAKFAGGASVTNPVTLASQPFFVRAGSILPLGPDVQYNGEKSWDDLEIRVYPGSDGAFTLYEDDFETYAYEQGAFSRIRFTWDDAARTLTIAAREGTFSGALEKRMFRVRLPDGSVKAVAYVGEAVRLQL